MALKEGFGINALPEEIKPLQVSSSAKILYSRNNYEDFDWKKELTEIDYAFLAVSATQMLNASERKLIEEVLMKYMGSFRFSIILTDTEVIQSVDDYKEVLARLEWYLSSIGAENTYYELGTAFDDRDRT